jgi:hypothetical protein
VKTINDIASFAVEDDAALVLCESKRSALVDLVNQSEVKK